MSDSRAGTSHLMEVDSVLGAHPGDGRISKRKYKVR